MISTLEKVKRLEQYLAVDSSAIDPVLQMAIDKLLAGETARLSELKKRLAAQLKEFEEHYALKSADFYTCFEKGEMGDSMDLIEWSATVECWQTLKNR